MLTQVRIRNLAIIREMTAGFDSGLHVITGETGSGKSIILHAISLLAGARASRSMIRQGADTLYVEGHFTPPDNQETAQLLAEYGVGPDDPVILSRTVQASGKSSARIQGQLVSLAELKQIGERLLDIYGQKDRALLEQDKQLGMLDSFLSEEQQHVKSDYHDLFVQRKRIIDFVNRYGSDAAARNREMDILRYQIEEIEAFDPADTDFEQLNQEHRKLLHAGELIQLSEQMDALLNGWSDDRPGAYGLFAAAEGLARKMEGLDSSFVISERFTEISEMMHDLRYEFAREAEQLQIDPKRLEELDARMSAWMQLQRKYGQDKEEVLRFYQNAQKSYHELQQREQQLADSERTMQRLTDEMTLLAARLHEERREIGLRLDLQIEQVLAGLRMPDVEFETRFYPVEFNESGTDQIVFHIRTNQGQAMQPLHEIASGGELSRVMLAIRSLFSKEFVSSTVVFDEIDTGVSGQAAQSMAEYLYTLSCGMQIIVVTHLPQIAAMGDAHSRIEKTTEQGETTSHLTQLEAGDRTLELARLISGNEQTKSACTQAGQLLSSAETWKQGGSNGL